MVILLSGLVIFFGIHTIPLFPSLKALLQSRVGAARFKGIYSLLALAGLVLILVGMSRADYFPIYAPPAWSGLIANLAMPISFCLFVAAYLPNNFRRVIRNPMLSGVIVWALAHLLTNGDLASMALFGSFGVYAAIDIVVVNRRSERAPQDRAPPDRQAITMDALVLIVGFAAFWAVRHYHVTLFGVPAAV